MPGPVLIYDGDCGVCTRMSEFATRVMRGSRGDFDVIAYQDADLPAVGLTASECDAALQWADGGGRISSGQDALARVLLAGRLPFRPLGRLILVPGVNSAAGIAYRWVARNRHRLPGGTPACSLPAERRPR